MRNVKRFLHIPVKKWLFLYFILLLYSTQGLPAMTCAGSSVHRLPPFSPTICSLTSNCAHCTACNSSDQKPRVFFYTHHTHVKGLKLLAGSYTCRCETQSRGMAWDAAAQSLPNGPHTSIRALQTQTCLLGASLCWQHCCGIPACRAAGRQRRSPHPHTALIVLIAHLAQRAIIKTFC